MDITHNLTNERIKKDFTNQFNLVSYAISLATDMIKTGRSAYVDMDSENPALLVLEEIAEGKDMLEEPSTEPVAVEEIVVEKTEEVLSE